MRRHHANFEDPGALLPRNIAEETAEEARESDINERTSVACSPDDVAIETVDHGKIGW